MSTALTPKLAVLTSHPIQYNAPLFRELDTRELELMVFYCWQGTAETLDPEFGRTIVWDTPLLEGYDYEFVENVSKEPGTHHFFGLDNPGMKDAIVDWAPDVLLIYGWPFKTNLSVLRHFKKTTPILFRGDSTLLFGNLGLRRWLRKVLLTWVYKHIDVALFSGRNNRDYFNAYGLKEDQLFWVPHSIDNRWFRKRSIELRDAGDKLKLELGIEEEDVVFLFSGKLVERKQPLKLIEALAKVRLDHGVSNFHLLVVGDGALYQEINEAASSVSWIHLMGFQNQSSMPMYYAMASVYVLPSVQETWGLAVNEAMATGKPCIVSDLVGCAADLILDGKNGFVYRHSSESDFAEALLAYILDPSRAGREESAVLSTIEGWSTEKAADRIETMVKRLVGSNE